MIIFLIIFVISGQTTPWSTYEYSNVTQNVTSCTTWASHVISKVLSSWSSITSAILCQRILKNWTSDCCGHSVALLPKPFLTSGAASETSCTYVVAVASSYLAKRATRRAGGKARSAMSSGSSRRSTWRKSIPTTSYFFKVARELYFCNRTAFKKKVVNWQRVDLSSILSIDIFFL